MPGQDRLALALDALTGHALRLSTLVLHVVFAVAGVTTAAILLGNPEFAAYALWTYVDTGDLFAAFVIGATAVLAIWIAYVGWAWHSPGPVWLPAAATVGFLTWQVFDFHRSVHVTRYVHQLPATWALSISLVAGMAASYALVWLIAFIARRSRATSADAQRT